MKKLLLFATMAFFCLGSYVAIKSFVLDSKEDILIKPMVEALSQAEFGQRGYGPCYQSLGFSLTVLYLDCNSCLYWYGIPYFLSDDTCPYL